MFDISSEDKTTIDNLQKDKEKLNKDLDNSVDKICKQWYPFTDLCWAIHSNDYDWGTGTFKIKKTITDKDYDQSFFNDPIIFIKDNTYVMYRWDDFYILQKSRFGYKFKLLCDLRCSDYFSRERENMFTGKPARKSPFNIKDYLGNPEFYRDLFTDMKELWFKRENKTLNKLDLEIAKNQLVYTF
jgi:hypothetical protein